MRSHRRRAASRAMAAATTLVALVALTGCGDEEPTDSTGQGEPTEPTVADPGDGDQTLGQVVADDVAVRSDGSEVAADCFEGLCRWSTGSGAIDRIDDRSLVALDPDWTLAVEIDDDAILLVDPDTDQVERQLTGIDGDVGDVAFGHDGQLVAAVAASGAVVVWSVADGDVVGEMDAAGDTEVAISPDGQRLAVGGGGSPIEVFDIASGDLLHRLADSGEGSRALAWSPDGQWLAGAGPSSTAAVWSTTGFDLVAELDVAVDQIAFSPDSTALAVTVREEREVRLWTPPALGGSGQEVQALTGHAGEPSAVAFSPDGATLYSVAADDYVRAWDVAAAPPVPTGVEFERPAEG